MTLTRIAALALTGVALTACISTEPIPTRDYGFVVLVGGPDGEGGHEVSDPLAYFLRTSNLSVSEAGPTTDQCEVGPLAGSNVPGPGLPYLDAGQSVIVTLSGGPIGLQRNTTTPNVLLYTLAGDFGYAPAGNITAAVPGADGGFPAMTITGTAASTFTVSEVPVSESPSSDIVLAWTPGPQAGRTTMNVSLRYAEASVERNRQIFCTLIDDGSYTVSRLIAEGWHESQGGSREALFERVRIEMEDSDEMESTLVLFSTYLVSAMIQDPAATSLSAR